MMTASPEDRPGRLLNQRYELVEQIGQGGMAVVWRALTHGSGEFRKTVAIKRIAAGFAGFDEIEAMFVEEARVGAALRHPNIVQIHDFGTDEFGRYYLVCEWVDGMHLGEYVKSFSRAGQPTPWPLVTAIAIDVLRALSAAHERRADGGEPAPILHRDVTPPNILLDVIGTIKLADFGMARAMDRGRMTRPDIVKGKLSYLAPEMVLGQAPSVQSDIFSLGIVLWEALTGERLFDADTDLNVIKLLRDAKVPWLSLKRPNLPMRLTTVVHRALEREPERRYASALDMLRELRAVLSIVSDPPTPEVMAQSFEAARLALSRPAAGAAPPTRPGSTKRPPPAPSTKRFPAVSASAPPPPNRKPK